MRCPQNWLNISFRGVDGKVCAFWYDRPEFEPAFCQTFFLPFHISYRIGKAFIFNKMKEIIKKLKIKFRVGLG